ncbi:YihY/virulence factor BrkB family protein [Noviherbaspirillum sp. UKPF54]|uniref:YihY/virulence factor BrkB family protein n=1 Tax=Noviherbaspirillum sp. UKPF54 TaxID=2601898 RepID=UPI0011B12DCF|nr:YihY/virulence factor BrkB family protein [Noviherbaspirillum sp. UKPF54]QDZ27563.1 YihY/virulence factor BrkB family protein [Noviherbaspirillum sp. UKPF54]
MQIPGLRGLSPLALIKESVKAFSDDDMSTYAAALSYQVLFSLFPFVLFLIALLGFLNLSDFFDWLRQQAQVFLPGQAMQLVDKVIHELKQPKGGLMSIGAIVALWTASAGIRATMNALNTAYDVEEGRPAWKLYPLSVVYTLGLAAMLIAAAALFIIGPQAVQWVARHLGLEQIFVFLWTWLRWPVVLFLLTLAIAVVYYVAPDVEQEFRFITPGAVLSVIVWIAASLGFDFYVRNFADYSASYGSVGAIIVMLLYFYISAAVLLFGAEVNAVIEHHAPTGKDPGEKKMP